ncbi:hypothetical protein NPIL_65391 [Nephila pilipes]|uniref:Uncharacterized protein n=1 Tax=Nephila pilipes TaxID=299642 RepID=A0A8X6TQQ7_NEPPI|nr:hypothetical protein NPIL_65391 [Nephila pilipes]
MLTENCVDHQNEVEPLDVCAEVELNFKRCETLEKKLASKKRKKCLKGNSVSSDEDDLNKSQWQQTEHKKSTKKKMVNLNDAIRRKTLKEPKKKSYVWKKADTLNVAVVVASRDE